MGKHEQFDKLAREAKEQLGEVLRNAHHAADIEGSRAARDARREHPAGGPPAPKAAAAEAENLYRKAFEEAGTLWKTPLPDLEEALERLHAAYVVSPDKKTKRLMDQVERCIAFRKGE